VAFRATERRRIILRGPTVSACPFYRLRTAQVPSRKWDSTLTGTTLFTEANGTLMTALDPSPTVAGTRAGFPALPQAYNGRLSIDPEGLVLLPDGTFLVER
jgi:hypothetical protein